jgi:hypothetical protein
MPTSCMASCDKDSGTQKYTYTTHSSPQMHAPYVAVKGDSMLPIAGPIRMPTLKDAISAPKPVALVAYNIRFHNCHLIRGHLLHACMHAMDTGANEWRCHCNNHSELVRKAHL